MVLLTFIAFAVLQTEAGLVSLGHFGTIGGEQVIVGEDVHAVVVAAHRNTHNSIRTHTSSSQR